VKQEFRIKHAIILFCISSFSIEYSDNDCKYLVHTLFVAKRGRFAPKKQDSLKTVFSFLASEILELLASTQDISFYNVTNFTLFS